MNDGMNVEELIAQLQKFPGHLRVATKEDGVGIWNVTRADYQINYNMVVIE